MFNNNWLKTCQTDAYNYTDSDSGCYLASLAIGCPSRCLECPYIHCVYSMSSSRRHKLVYLLSTATPLYKLKGYVKKELRNRKKVKNV
jgi:hypothetical protein